MALALVDATTARLRSVDLPELLADAEVARARVLLDAGRRVEALAALRRGVKLYEDLGVVISVGRAGRLCAEVAR